MRFTAKVAGPVFAVVSLYLAAALVIGPDTANVNLCAVVDHLWVGAGARCTTNSGVYAVRAAAVVAAVSLGALLIDAGVWYIGRRTRRKMTIIPAVISAPTPIADMPIRDVFFHIDADVLEHGQANLIGQNLLDLLSTGQLKAYGRRAHFGNNAYVGFPNLSPIDTEYWKTADFTYDFFGENREQDVHVDTRKPAQGPSYRDLRFDSDAIKQRWIKSNPSDQIFAMRAIHNVLSQSEWAHKLAISPNSMPALHYESGMTREEVIKRRLIASLKYDLHDHLRAGDIDVSILLPRFQKRSGIRFKWPWMKTTWGN